MDKEIVVIDLDGTFMHVNTFHKWMKFVLKEELKALHIISVLKILKTVILRYLKRINHAQMKYDILTISEKNIHEKKILSFVSTLNKYVNPNILNILQNNSDTTILATAAPMQYATYIKAIYHFDYVIATEYTYEKDWQENIKENKKKNLLGLMKKYHLHNEVSTLYTDHHDDLPLMKSAKFTYLVNPSEKTKQYALDEDIIFKLC